MGIPSDPRFVRVATSDCGTCSQCCPRGMVPQTPDRFAADRGADRRVRAPAAPVLDDVLLVDSTPGRVRPLEGDGRTRRSLQTRRRAWRRRRLRLLRQPQPLLLRVSAARPVRARRHPPCTGADLPKIDEKHVCLQMVARCERQPGQVLILIGDKNFRGKTSRPNWPLWTPRSSAPAAKTNPAADRTSRRSVNASKRSSGPSKTSSPSNATAPAPCTTSAPDCARASPRSPPQSRSTTNSAAQPARSSPTPRKPVAQVIWGRADMPDILTADEVRRLLELARALNPGDCGLVAEAMVEPRPPRHRDRGSCGQRSGQTSMQGTARCTSSRRSRRTGTSAHRRMGTRGRSSWRPRR